MDTIHLYAGVYAVRLCAMYCQDQITLLLTPHFD